MRNTRLSARTIVEQAMKIAAETCIYTNEVLTVEELPQAPGGQSSDFPNADRPAPPQP